VDEDEQPLVAGGHGPELRPYRELIGAFVRGDLSVAAFESQFLQCYLHDDTEWAPAEFDLLDGLFADVDEFVDDPRLRAEVGGLDAETLRQRAADALTKLNAMDGS
jgi:hypothetical protein